ncbi:MAG TPA: BMC domain-containing protein [Candidatus Rifleibacterium sp.]|jgi:ethanolamine utilization microcompartment shell protein EutS|nr:BMC domain-containing protein [Candidatus Rifleibacterium sp.]HPW57462.1 BMC domain-containing protein [Candidatus Rifleibacterium sp.]HQB84356.1 BMC domain-containing protein [Candidatus Rifleibacterium sp.]
MNEFNSNRSIGVTIRLVKRPSKGFWAILEGRRVDNQYFEKYQQPTDAVGLIQGPVSAILAASDIAEKAAAVQVAEIRGVCPTHMTLIAVYGDTSAVEAALQAVNDQLCDTLF